jgi:RNA polymerase sigma factor (TIGR02999 family)
MADITALLDQWRSGDQAAIDSVCHLLYEELHDMAARRMRAEQGGRTMQATALVHEVYLRLRSIQNITWEARGQFFAVVARMMRNILVDDARKRAVRQRGAVDWADVGEIAEESLRGGAPDEGLDLVAMDLALHKMAEEAPRSARVVELRFFGGLSAEECAVAMQISLSTVEREWRFGKAWLQSEIAG